MSMVEICFICAILVSGVSVDVGTDADSKEIMEYDPLGIEQSVRRILSLFNDFGEADYIGMS